MWGGVRKKADRLRTLEYPSPWPASEDGDLTISENTGERQVGKGKMIPAFQLDLEKNLGFLGGVLG